MLIKWNHESGLIDKDMPPIFTNIFRKAGIKSEDLDDKILNKIIMKTIFETKINHENISLSILDKTDIKDVGKNILAR